MVEDIQNGMDEVIKLHVDTIKEIGVTAEASGKLVNNLATLYELRQKDEDREAKFDFEREKTYVRRKRQSEMNLIVSNSNVRSSSVSWLLKKRLTRSKRRS